MGGIGSSVLTGFYNFGKDSRLVGMSTDIASLTVRSPLTLLDKKTDKETKRHAALWQAMDYTFAILLQCTIFPFVPKVGKTLAKNIFKYENPKAISGAIEFFNFFVGYFLITSVMMPLINSTFLTKAANFVSEKVTGKKVLGNEAKVQEERKKQYEDFKNGIKAKIRAATEKVLGASITDAIVKTLSGIKKGFNIITSPITYPAKKIGDTLANFTINTINFIRKDTVKDKEKAQEGLGKFFRNTLYFGLSLIPLTILGRKFGPSLGKKLENFMVKENNISSTTTLIRTRIADGTAKPLILLASGAPYMALRKFVDQIVSVIFLKGSEPLINKATKAVTRAKGLDKIRSEGFKSMLVTVFQTFFLLNVALPLFNNEITGRIFKAISGKKKKGEEKATQAVKNDQNNNQVKEMQLSQKQLPNSVMPINKTINTGAPINKFDAMESFIAQNTILYEKLLSLNAYNPGKQASSPFDRFENYLLKTK